MSFEAEVQSRLAQLSAAWNAAEEAAKCVEHLLDGYVVFPSIKELRYAGRQLVDALALLPATDEATQEKVREKLIDARLCCVRARHDAVDAATLYVTMRLNEILSTFDSLAGYSWVPDLKALKAKLFEVRKLIAQTRKDRNCREDIYAQIIELDLNAMMDVLQRLEQSEIDALSNGATRAKATSTPPVVSSGGSKE